MNRHNGLPWQTVFGAWAAITFTMIAVFVLLTVLGTALWSHYLVTSAGVEALKTSGTQSSTTTKSIGTAALATRMGRNSQTEADRATESDSSGE